MGVLRSTRDDAGGLEAWLDAGYPAAYRTAWLILRNHADAEEAVQDAFLRAWRFRDAIPAGGEVKPWLYRVVVNACMSKLRADKSRGLRTWAALDEGAEHGRGRWDHDGDPSPIAEAHEAHVAVVEALGALPEHLRVVVVLRYFAQLSEKEIAEVIRRRPGTVKSRLHEARGRLGADTRLAGLAPLGGSAEETR